MPRYSFLFILFILICPAVISAQFYQPVSGFDDEAGITVMTSHRQRSDLIAGDENGNLYIRDLQTGLLKKKIKAHSKPVKALQFNSNGNLLISCTADGEIKIFDFEKDEIIQSIYSPEYNGIHFVLFSIADGFIYFNGNNKLYKTRSDLTQKVDLVQVERDSILDAVITSDRNSMIYSTGNILKVLNTRTDQVKQQVNVGGADIERLSLVGDTILVSWSKDGSLDFWKYDFGQLGSKPIYFMKAGNPSPMTFNTTGNLMVSGNIGTWARLWKPFDRKIVQELFGHGNTVTSASFGISDNFIFTGGLDHKIILWQKLNNSLPPPALKPDSIVKTTDSQKAENVVITDNNVPKIIEGRRVATTQNIKIKTQEITIYVFDDSYIDGDTMSLFFNGEWILQHYGVTKRRRPVTLSFKENTNNYLVLFANNLGRTPPNTAAIEFYDGAERHYVRLSSDLKACSAINFIYNK